MWLLDHNLPSQLRPLLAGFGVDADTTRFRRWESLRNGELVSTAYATGFKVILTRDMKFGESAGKALATFPDMSVVIIRITQRSSKLYIAAFREEWEKHALQPQPGKVLFWP